MGHFCPPGSGSGSTSPIESGSNPGPDPIRVRIRNPGGYNSIDSVFVDVSTNFGQISRPPQYRIKKTAVCHKTYEKTDETQKQYMERKKLLQVTLYLRQLSRNNKNRNN